jgi:hypothetical protein
MGQACGINRYIYPNSVFVPPESQAQNELIFGEQIPNIGAGLHVAREEVMGRDKVVRVSRIAELDAALDREAHALLKESQRSSGTTPFALRRAVDASLPQLTRVDAGLPNSQICKTKPPQSHSCLSSAASADAHLARLTAVDVRLPNSQMRGTNPRPTADLPAEVALEAIDLSPRQLAAARMLARGCKPADVAQTMKITRQGLWKWRRQPAFIAELRRLHELLARPRLAHVQNRFERR